jgi:hypothetical protein
MLLSRPEPAAAPDDAALIARLIVKSTPLEREAAARIEQLVSERDAAVRVNTRLWDVILWLDGQQGEFRPRGKNEGAYWWRKEMLERASIDAAIEAAK